MTRFPKRRNLRQESHWPRRRNCSLVVMKQPSSYRSAKEHWITWSRTSNFKSDGSGRGFSSRVPNCRNLLATTIRSPLRAEMKALYRLGYHRQRRSHAEEHTAQGAPPPEQVIAHTNLYWNHQTAPGRTARIVETKDVNFDRTTLVRDLGRPASHCSTMPRKGCCLV